MRAWGGSDECAVGRLECTEGIWDARGSLLLSVGSEVVAGCGDPLPLGLQPRGSGSNGLFGALMTAQPFWLGRRGDEGPVQERRKRLEL